MASAIVTVYRSSARTPAVDVNVATRAAGLKGTSPVFGSTTGASASAVPTTAKELGSMVLASMISEKVASTALRLGRFGSITSVSLGSITVTFGVLSPSTTKP
jgi:hypothetical protein